MRYIITIWISLVILLSGCNSRSVDTMQSKIDQISKKYVPDKRVAICNLKLVKRQRDRYILQGESMFPAARTEILQLLIGEGYKTVDSVLILPDSIHIENRWGLISLSVANLRSKSAHSSELISQAIMGTPVKLLKESDDWFLVQTPDCYISWTNKSSVQEMGDLAFKDWQKADRLIYTNTCGTIFQDEKQTAVLSDLVAGAIVVKLSENQFSTQVSLPDGRLGFVSKQNWLNFNRWKDTVSLNGDNMITCGKRYIGFPYLWGGTSSKALDCSGFVKTVCFLNGVVLERDASQQIKHGIEVDMSAGWDKLLKGDLLYFGSKQPYRVTHTGMYIGEGDFIHESGSVRINSFDENKPAFNSELNSKLLGARRIIGMPTEPGFWHVRQHNWY